MHKVSGVYCAAITPINHDCSINKENEDLNCIICGGLVGCSNCEFIENCNPNSV